MRGKYVFITVLVLALGLTMGFGVGRLSAAMGTLDSPGVPAATLSYTLQDIWSRLATGAAGAQSTFTEPAAGPGPTMHTLNEIMGKAPAADNTTGATTANVLNGTTFWGLNVTAGQWGPQTGAMPDREGDNASTSQSAAAGVNYFTAPDGYYDGDDRVSATDAQVAALDADLAAGNIKQGVNIFGVAGNVIQASGDAAAGDVLSGKTFSNVGAAGIAGTMPDNGAVNITPGTSAQAIAAGYHNGSGQVAGDADLVAGNIKSGVTLFGVAGTLSPGALAKRVAKTGQAQCWNESGGTVDCTGTGQDGQYQAGIDPVVAPTCSPDCTTTGAYNTPAWTGVRFTDNGDGTVTDNLTALIWLKNANCFGMQTWANALSAANTLASGSCGLSDGSVAGAWRLPNVNELHSLGPTWPPGAPFSGVRSGSYWSGTTDAGDTSDAWSVYLNDGLVGTIPKSLLYYVWPVRGGQ